MLEAAYLESHLGEVGSTDTGSFCIDHAHPRQVTTAAGAVAVVAARVNEKRIEDSIGTTAWSTAC